MMCLGVFLFGSNFFGTLWASWTSWKSVSFARLGKFPFITFSNKFSMSCSPTSPSGTPVIWMLECLKMSWRFLSLSSFSWILVSSFCSGWMFISSSAPNHWFESQFPSHHCWFPFSFLCSVLFPLFHFSLPSLFPLFFNHTQPFLWEFWLSVFWTLHLIG